MTIDDSEGKPKISTIERMSKNDLSLVNKLVLLCSQYYYDLSHPSKPGPHRNPENLDNIKQQILTLSLRVGERIWFPREGINHFKELKLKVDRYAGDIGRKRIQKSQKKK